MEKNKVEKYNAFSLKELSTTLQELEQDLKEIYKKRMLGKLDNRNSLVVVRRNIARVKTFMSSKEVLNKDESKSSAGEKSKGKE